MTRWIFAAVLLATGCKNAPSEDQCQQLLDRLIDLEFKKAGAAGSDAVKADLAKQKRAVAEAKASEFIQACTQRTPRSRIECALSAADLEGVAKCDEVK